MEKIKNDELDLNKKDFQKEKEKENKKEVLEAINGAISLIEKIPEEKRTEREKWILNTTKESLTKIDDKGKILVGGEGGFGSGEKKFIKHEGVPVDELIGYLEEKAGAEFLEKIVEKEKKDFENVKNFDDGKSLDKKRKESWHHIFRGFDKKGSGLEVDLINETEKRVESWEKIDGREYEGVEKTEQLGEALYQIIKERLESSKNLSEKEKKQITETVQFLKKIQFLLKIIAMKREKNGLN